MIENIDNYLKKNKKQFFTMMNSHWGKNDDDTKKLKFLWNKALEANGVNNKIEAFEELKTAMTPFIHNDRLAENEKILEENNIDKFAYPEDQMTLEMDRMFSALSNFPETDRLQDLNIDEVWSQHYDYDQMKELAKDYGYDYRNKEDRIEFLEKLREYHNAKDVEDTWENDKTVRGAIASLTNPIMKEYAKKHWEEIPADAYVSDPIFGAVGIPTNAGMNAAAAADIGVNTLMSGPFKFKWNPATVAANNVAAPLARQAAQVGLNDKPMEDAAKDFVGETITNYATPTFVTGAKSRIQNMLGIEKSNAAQTAINEAAVKAKEVGEKIKRGVPYVSKGKDGKLKYYIQGKEVPDHVARNAANGEVIPWTDVNDFKVLAYMQKTNNFSDMPKDIAAEAEQRMLNTQRAGAVKAEANDVAGKPWYEGLNGAEIAGAANVTPKETVFNWAANSNLAKGIGNYWNNQLGRSQYAGRTLNQIGRLLPGAENIDWFSTKNSTIKPLSDSDKKELGMLERLRDLHMKNPKLFGMPKLPDKFKDYVNPEDWNDEQLTIKGIFGDR